MGAVSFALALLVPAVISTVEGVEPGSETPDGIYVRESTIGSGTVFDPRIDQVWNDWSSGGIVNRANSHLVTESVSSGLSANSDTRAVSGEGEVVFEIEYGFATKEWVWNKQDFHDPAGINVLVKFGGTRMEHGTISTYSSRGLQNYFEANEEKGNVNATEAIVLAGIDATRFVRGFRTETEDEWNEFLEYKTLQDHATMQFEIGVWEGTMIEKSETLVPPIKLKVKKTVTWAEWDPVAFGLGGGAWVQRESVTETIEEGPWWGQMPEPLDDGDADAEADAGFVEP